MRAASLLAFLVLAGSATAAVFGGGGEPAAEASAVAAEGSFSFANSGDGMPIFSATGIAPGESVSGSVEIANSGELPGELVLAQHDVEDVPGPGGGELSRRLTVRIADVTVPANPATVYAGPLAPMSARPAGRLLPGESRTYEFVATLPEAGSADGTQNDVQGASASVAYSWTANEVTASPVPAPHPSPSPGQPPSSSPNAPVGSAPASPLRLTITRVRHTIRRGRLLVWARCNRSCAIAAKGRLRVKGPAGNRGARLHLVPRPHFAAGTQRLAIRVPHQLRHRLEASPSQLRVKARIALLARDSSGDRTAARRTVRVRQPRDR